MEVLRLDDEEAKLGLLNVIQVSEYGFIRHLASGAIVQIDPSEMFGLHPLTPRASSVLRPCTPVASNLRGGVVMNIIAHGVVSIYDRKGRTSIVSYYIVGLTPGEYSFRVIPAKNAAWPDSSDSRPKGEIAKIVATASGLSAGFFYTDLLRVEGTYSCIENSITLFFCDKEVVSGAIKMAPFTS